MVSHVRVRTGPRILIVRCFLSVLRQLFGASSLNIGEAEIPL